MQVRRLSTRPAVEGGVTLRYFDSRGNTIKTREHVSLHLELCQTTFIDNFLMGIKTTCVCVRCPYARALSLYIQT